MELSPQYFWTVIVGTFVFLALIGAFVVSLVTSVRRLQQQQDFTTGILNTTDALIVVLDGKGRVVHFNKACEARTGYQAGEFLGRELKQLPIFTNGSPFDKTEFTAKLPSTSFESRCRARDGTIYDIAWTGTALNGSIGNMQSILTGIDITARKEMEGQLSKSRQQLRRLSAHLQTVREEERAVISRELHDELGQSLSILQMDLSWLENHPLQEKKAWLDKISSMSMLVDNTMQTVQEIARELRPSLLDNLGLPAAIEWQTREFQKRTGIRCEINEISEGIKRNPDISIALYRILQEALTNVVRHANAKSVKINLVEKDNRLTLSIKDNGVGITEDRISNPDSMGIIGMKERVNSIRGEFKIQGLPGKGTTLMVRIPIQS